jgi:hypothetical protein
MTNIDTILRKNSSRKDIKKLESLMGADEWGLESDEDCYESKIEILNNMFAYLEGEIPDDVLNHYIEFYYNEIENITYLDIFNRWLKIYNYLKKKTD